MSAHTLTKTEDRYFEEVAEGLDCRMRVFTPSNPQETVIVLITWVPRTPDEVLEPCFLETIAGLREAILGLATSRNLHNFSLVEHHALPGEERIGLIVLGEMPDSPNFWQQFAREALEELLGEDMEAPVSTA